jgi:Secretion system C-terminal sorting domain/Beta-propeller repeat
MESIKIILLLIFGSLCCNIYAQMEVEWAKSLGGSGIDEGRSIAIDATGNAYTTGVFENTVDFDPSSDVYNLTSSGAYDIFISKMDANGNFLWSKSIGGSEYDTGNSISVDAFGNVIVSGRFSGTVDFDPGATVFNLSSGELSDIFICKLNILGNFVWAKQFGGSDQFSYETSTSTVVDQFGNIYSAGYFLSTVDFDPSTFTYNLTSVGNPDSFIIKLDSLGNLIWVKQFKCLNESNRAYIYSLAIDNEQSIYVSGETFGSIDCNPNTENFDYLSSQFGIFIIKLGMQGNYIWAKQFSPVSGNLNLSSIFVDSEKNVYTTGSFDRSVDFDPNEDEFILTVTGGNNNYTDDVFVNKLDSLGNFMWAKNFGGTTMDKGKSIFVDEFGSIFTTGYFSGVADFDPSNDTFSLLSVGYYDIFISKLNSLGDFVNAYQLGGSFFEQGNAILVGENNSIYTLGSFHETVDFDPSINTYNLMSGGNSDIFIHKMSAGYSGLYDFFSEDNRLSLYPNPSSNEVTIDYSLSSLQNVDFGIYDIRGRLVQKIEKGKKQAGKYVLKVDISNLANGIYIIQMRTGDDAIFKKLLKE